MAGPTGARVRIVSNRLGEVPPAIRAAVAREIERGARGIEATAKQKCPVRTGTLRRSIHTVIADGGMRAVVGPSVDYGDKVEWGTRHMPAHPYMRPAAELELPRLLEAVRRALGGVR